MKIEVTVKPGTSQEKIVEDGEGVYTVYLRAKAHDGEANEALIKLLAKHFGVAKTTMRIVRGQNSRRKMVEW